MYYYVDIRWYGMTCKVDLHPSTSSPYLETFWEVHLLLTQPAAFPLYWWQMLSHRDT